MTQTNKSTQRHFFKLIFIVTLLLAFGITSCKSIEKMVPMIGLDEEGQATHVLINESDYSSTMTSTMKTFYDSTMSALKEGVKPPLETNDWALRTVVVGVGINMEIGVGPAKVGIVPKFRMQFTNSSEPILP